MYKFICPRCGKPGEVPFVPSNPDRVLCSACHEETGGKTFDLSKTSEAPRRRHNTRVVINIVCSECGKEAELDYKPKGVPLNKLKCEECLAAEYGEGSRWAMVRELKDREQKRLPRKTYKIKCVACGQETELPFRPDPEKEYYCQSCYINDGVPLGPNYREGKKTKVQPNLFLRKRKTPPDSLAVEAPPSADEEE